MLHYRLLAFDRHHSGSILVTHEGPDKAADGQRHRYVRDVWVPVSDAAAGFFD
jgi:hypothetical protein